MTFDPYLLPGTECLRNRLNIRDADELAEAELRLVSLRDVMLARNPLPGEYDLDHLTRIHAYLFGDVYDWAGELRTVNIGKPGGILFGNCEFIEASLQAVLGQLVAQNFLLGLDRSSFVAAVAYYYGEINSHHPFREGNGRSQRAFLRQLAASAGWRVNWALLDPSVNNAACHENLATGDTACLISILEPLVTELDGQEPPGSDR